MTRTRKQRVLYRLCNPFMLDRRPSAAPRAAGSPALRNYCHKCINKCLPPTLPPLVALFMSQDRDLHYITYW